jgi:hypothetical protein
MKCNPIIVSQQTTMSHVVDAKIICLLLENAARMGHVTLTGLIQIILIACK